MDLNIAFFSQKAWGNVFYSKNFCYLCSRFSRFRFMN